MWSVITETVRLLNESAIYLLLGFALAGVLHVVMGRSERFASMLSRKGTRSVVWAALLGVPLPLCSCGVLPAGLALRKKGATKGATVSFLISVPETDIVSILITYGLLGPVMAVARPLAALVTAVFTGQLMNLVDRDTEPSGDESRSEETVGECCSKRPPARGPVGSALHYGFVEFLDDIIGSLIVGIVLGGVISAMLPRIGLEQLGGGSLLTMLAMLAVGIPMYLCATASTPIAVGLIVGGVSPGAALVFLLAGPATNTASIIVLAKHLGRLALGVYLGSIALVSVMMGLALDAVIGAAATPALTVVPTPAESPATPLEIGAAVLFAVLALRSLRRTRTFERSARWIAQFTGLPLTSGRAKVVLAAAAAGAYLYSGFFVVGPGQRGVITRFGRITQANLTPGLYYHWPYPVGDQDVEAVNKIRRIELGFVNRQPDTGSPGGTAGDAEDQWLLTGNEDIIDIRWVVQYRIGDSGPNLLNYLYGVSNQRQLVRDAAEAAIRAVVGGRNIDTLLTADRRAVEEQVRSDHLQPLLDRCRAGIEIVGVKLQDVHAPPPVHSAFRDLASADEDRQTSINLAYEYRERVTRQAAGDAAKRVLGAGAEAVELVERASGEGSAFVDRLCAYQAAPSITRLRIHFESVDAVLGRLDKYINLVPGLEGGLDLWMVPDEIEAPLPGIGPEDRRGPR